MSTPAVHPYPMTRPSKCASPHARVNRTEELLLDSLQATRSHWLQFFGLTFDEHEKTFTLELND